jgi:hypothetical protein
VKHQTQSIKHLKTDLRDTLEREFGDHGNAGIIEMSDVIVDHVQRVGPEVMSPQLAFVGLLHVIAENSKKSMRLVL